MLVYGKNVAREIINSDTKINKLYLNENFSDKEILNLINKNNIKVIKKNKNELNNLINENHQGIIIDIEDYKFYDIKSCLDENFVIILDHLEDPHNLGAIIRTAECAGIKSIIIPNKKSVSITPTVMKSSAGALTNIKIIEVNNINKAINNLKGEGFWVIGAEANGVDYKSGNYDGKTALVIGSEGSGIKEYTKSLCDEIVSLPLKGKINSLNASVACGILIYEIIKYK